jgi:50S ribosomal protein L16 3-hydroxylase
MLTHLGDMTTEEFLQDYWQKKPLLIRRCFAKLECPLDENDLAGLALEEEVESRLIFEKRHGKPWQLERGPFKDKKLRTLPDQGWTLLIQGLDQWVPEIADLLDEFRFLPGWRLDDIMASFAPPGGSVGPHYDHYDVFLIQATGRRRWLVGPRCDENSPRVEGTPLRILDGFPVESDWVLEPGDALYLPPAYAHHGIAVDNCITLSVGFRSPTMAEMISSFADYWIPQTDFPAFRRDYAEQHSACGLIPTAILDDFRQSLTRLLQNDTEMHGWIGRFLSQPKSDAVVQTPEEESLPDDKWLLDALQNQTLEVRWNDGSRYLYHVSSTADPAKQSAAVELFVDGHGYWLPASALPFVQGLCLSNRLPEGFLQDWLSHETIPPLVIRLIRQGSLIVIGE